MIESCYTCQYGVWIGLTEDYEFPVMECRLGRTLRETVYEQSWNECFKWEQLQVAEGECHQNTMKDKLLHRLKRR
jgi:hypothetical protein